jgi:hypothetical protein
MNVPAWARWTGANLVLAACHPTVLHSLPSPVASLAVGTVIFLAPAVGWGALCGPAPRTPGMRLTRDVSISTSALLAILVACWCLGIIPTQWHAWVGISFVTNAGFLGAILARRPLAVRTTLSRRELLLGAMLFVGAYALYYYGATRVVPPQEDHDLEIQTTGYSLLTRFEPLLVTDRFTIYYFAHPPLLHFYAGASFLYYGAFPALEFFDAASRRARDISEGRSVTPPDVVLTRNDAPHRVTGVAGTDYILTPERGGPPVRVPVSEIENGLVISRWERQPYPLETRTPNLFLASVTVALLGVWASRISRRWAIATIAAIAYATSPEVFVRSSYGGYFAIGTCFTLLMLLGVDGSMSRATWRRSAAPALTGVLTALSDHKMVLLPLAMAIHGIREWWRRRRGQAAIVAPVIAGFAIGTLLFWMYGLAIAPAAFLEDHLGHHLVDRLTHRNPLGYGGYPTAIDLWREFIAHTGFVLVPVSLALLLYDTGRGRIFERPRRTSARELWLLWMLLVAVGFSVVDWRMTKHLVPMLVPLHLGLLPPRAAPRWRRAVPLVTLLCLLAWNAWSLGGLIDNFDGFTVTPAW